MLLLALLAVMAAAQSAPSALAPGTPTPSSLKPTGFVNDFAHVLNPSARVTLERRAALLNQLLGVQVAMVTVETTGGDGAFNYSYSLAQSWGVGSKVAKNGQDRDTGMLIFLAVKDRTYFTQVGYGMEPYITDGDVGTWMRALVPQLRAANYGAVFSGMLDQIQTTLAARMPGARTRLSQIPANLQPRSVNQGPPPGSMAGLVIILLIIWVLGALASRGRGGRGGIGGWLWPLLLLNIMMNQGGGYRGGGWGGGFGGGGFGGGGGGGFGGFGGGGFGGGGAGGSW